MDEAAKLLRDIIIDRTEQAFFDRKEDRDRWQHYHGFTTKDGKQICCFWHKSTNSVVMVYLNSRGVLMPYFGEEE